jgi:DNA ligase-1
MSAKLKKLQEFVDKMKSTSSLLEKKQIIETIKDDNFITNALYYTYNPFLKYYVTSKNCKKRTDLIDNDLDYPLFTLLDALINRDYTGHDAIALVNGFVVKNIQYRNLIYSIIDRNLEIRASESVINKVIPGLIPTFDVALATKYEPKFCDFENEEWLVSRKLDGVRCIIRKEEDSIVAYSRQGNEFTTLQKVLDEVSKIPGNFVFDGETCMIDENGHEDFQ